MDIGRGRGRRVSSDLLILFADAHQRSIVNTDHFLRGSSGSCALIFFTVCPGTVIPEAILNQAGSVQIDVSVVQIVLFLDSGVRRNDVEEKNGMMNLKHVLLSPPRFFHFVTPDSIRGPVSSLRP